MRISEAQRAAELTAALSEHHENVRVLPGIATFDALECLVEQLIESERRVRFVSTVASREISPDRSDPNSDSFDPVRAAIRLMRSGQRDEAFWVVFLSTHFGHHSSDRWRLMRAVYGNLANQPHWTWERVSSDLGGFRRWVVDNYDALRQLRFGNHRKYESLNPASNVGLPDIVESYVAWVSPPRTHDELIAQVTGSSNDPHTSFDRMYASARSISRWGRLAAFDHLCMLGKIGLANLEPGKAYLSGATGPRRGVSLLLTGAAENSVSIKDGEQALIRLGASLGVGQQVLEDSLCNWQKSPKRFIPFR